MAAEPDHPSTSDIAFDVKNEVILASAGTGKTQSLSARYLRLVHGDQAPERILATTFTRKAAGEIFERIFERLAQSVHDETTRGFLSDQVGDELSVERCQDLLVRLTRRLHQIRVGTLDSFFQQVALSLAPELGLPPAWEITDEIDDARLRGEALRRMLDKHPLREVTELMHLLGKGAVGRRTTDFLMSTINSLFFFYRDSLVEGDKAWKTKGLPATLDEEGLANAIQVFRTTPMPTSAWQQKHDKSLDEALSEKWSRFLTVGIGAAIAKGNDKFSRKEIPPDVIAVYRPLIDHARALHLYQEAKKVAAARDLIQKFAVEYEQLKIDRESISFDDIPVKLAEMSRNDRDRLAYRMDAQLDHLLLDEFQDTSGMQWRAIRPFADRVTRNPDDESGAEMSRSLFCVGDVKQAIYGWRGGQAEILQTLKSQLQNVEQHTLADTYRCSAPVIEAVNQVFERIPSHPNLGDFEEGIAKWCREFPKHTAAKKHAGYVALMTGDLDPEDQAVATLRSAAKCVAELQRAMSSKQTIGVLVKTNKTVRDLINYLRDEGVWASQEGSTPLTDSAAIQQILSACRLADNPGDDVARFHLQQGLLKEEGTLLDRDRGQVVAAEFRRRLVEDGYGVVVRGWAEDLQPLCSDRERRRLRQLVELAFVYQARLSDSRSALRPGDFVDFVENEKVSNATAARVRVMVTHQSKGLQFDAVVVAELDRPIGGQSPSFVVRRSHTQFWPEHIFTYSNSALRPTLPREIKLTQDRDTESRCREAMCGLYVAMTRSIHALYMFVSPNDPEKKKPSFPKKISGLVRVGLRDTEPVAPNEVLCAIGDEKWFERNRKDVQPAAQPQVAKRIRLKRGSQATGAAGRGQETLSPSQRSAGAVVRGNDWFGRDRASAMEYGSLIHAWFEQVEWLEKDLFGGGPPDEGLLRSIAIRLPVKWVSVDKALSDFHRMLGAPLICNLFHQNTYVPEFSRWLKTKSLEQLPTTARFEVRNEQPIVFEDDGRVGTGTIDRLVLVYVGDQIVAAEVIDHKTDGARKDSDVQKHAMHYGPQIRKYRDAVSEMFGLSKKRIRMRLALVNGGRIAEVDG